MLGYLTGADVAASTDPTGNSALGGNWDLEYHDGDIASDVIGTDKSHADFVETLNVATSNGNGALLVSAGRSIYSVDVLTGKATMITTVPNTVGGITVSNVINSLAADQANGLIYYVDSSTDPGNKALFAYDYINNTHILVDSDLTTGATTNISTGTTGVGGGAATFYNGALYLGVENLTGSSDQIYRITFSNNGRTMAGATAFGALITTANDWGDFAIDAANNALLSVNASTITRYNLSTGAIIDSFTNVGGSTNAQGGGDINGNTYLVGTEIRQINPTTGAAIGSAVTITTNGTTALTGISDAARWTPPTGTIGDKIFADNDKSGTFNTGDAGIGNVTVQLIDDVNGDGLVSAGERVLATDTTDANGNYLFTGVLPGQYVVRITDANGVLGTAPITTGTATQSLALATIGAANLAADFGYVVQAPIVDLNSGTTPTQIITNGGTPGTTGWAVGGTGATANGGFAWTLNGGTGTLTQANVSGWTDGLAPSGAAQLTFDLGWSNDLLLGISNDNNTPATLDVTIGGVLYARITTGTLNGTPNTATITYFNGATGSPSTVAASTAGTTAWNRTAVTINLPSTVVATGDLVFSYSAAGGLLTPSTDDIFIDNVSAFRNVDTLAGVNYATTYTENGAGVSISSAATDVRDLDSTNMRSATIVLTNAQAGDLLTVGTLPTGISGSVDTSVAGQVTVTLTGSATKASYAAAIKAITFSNTGDNPSTTPRVVNVTVNDGGLSSAIATSTISVVAVNDAPVNSLPTGWSTNEDTSVGLTGLSIADLDAGTGSMTVTLSVPTGTITAASGGSVTVSGSGTGTVVLTGTLANINTYLASASAPVYVPVADANGSVVLTMTTNDNGNTGTGGALTDVDTRNITIVAVNDAPVLDLDGSTSGTGYLVGYTENGTGVAISNTNSSVVDVDNTNMASASVVISNGQTGDLLAVTGTLPAGITASYNASTFTLTLTGSATKAAYETALRQVLYTSNSDNPTLNGASTSRNISVTVNDGSLNSNSAITTVAITAVNDAPVNTLPTSWTTNEDTNVTLTGLSIADPDAGTGNMTVRLQVPTGILTAASTGSVTVSGSGTGTMVLTGTLANINAYLASAAAPIYVPVADANGAVTLTMTTSDLGNFGTGGPLTDTDTATINITPVNDAPILDLDASGAGTGFSNTYTEKGTGVAIADTDGVITDVDNANMASLTAMITNGQTGDLLAVSGTLPAGITASYNASTFTLTLTGSATKASYEAALQQIRFLSSSDNPSTTPRTINVSVNDGAATSNIAVATVNVISVNDAPVNTVPGSVTLDEDVQSAISGISVADVDSGSVTVTLSVANGTLSPSVTAGTITGNGTGTVTVSGTLAQVNSVLASLRYTSKADFNGSDTLTVATSDGSLTDTDTVAITVNPVADITPDTVTTAEDTALTFNVITGTNGATPDSFKDPSRAVTSITQPPAGQGSVTFAADGTLVYTPSANFNGQTTFTYTVTSGGVTETATVTVNVTAVNDAPVNTLPASGWTTNEDTGIALSGLSISDVDAGNGTMTVTLAVGGGTLAATSASGVAITGSGSASLTLSGTLSAINAYLASASVPVFTPATNANGAVTLTMTTSDGGNTGTGGILTDTDTRTITINAVNDAPVNTLPSGGWTTDEDSAVSLSGLSIADVDAGNGTVSVVLGVSGGQLTATSGAGVTISGSGTSSLTLSGTLASINAYLASTARPLFTPTADFNGAVTLTMTTNDGGNTGSGGALTDVDTATITVNPVNDAPTLDLDASAAGTGYATSYTENGAGVAIVNTGVLVSDIDSANMASATVVITNAQAGDALSVSGTLPAGITASYNPATFTLTLSGSASKVAYQTALGQIRYASSSDDPGTTARSISVTVSDGALASNTAIATVAVVAVNDPPVNGLPANGWSIAEDGSLSLTGLSVTDPDAGTGVTTVTLSVGSGTLSAATGSGVTVSGSGTATITLSGTLANINAYLTSTARPSYSPVADFNGSVTLTMTSSDGQLTDTDTQTITVTPVADITNDNVATNEDTAVVIDVNSNDSFENPVHTITAINGGAIVANGVVIVTGGTVRLNADGTLTFTPSANLNGNTSFTYTVTSGGVTETATVNVNMVPVNDAPVNTVPGAQTVAEDTPLAIGGVSVADVDGDTLTTTITVTNGIASVATGSGATVTSNGTATVRISGTAAQVNAALAGLTYTATADYNGAAQLTIQTFDGALTDTDTVAISITPVADIVADTVTTNEDTAITFNAITGTNGASADNFENPGRVISSVTQPPSGQGTVTFAADGTITYTPAANFNGATSFTYTVTSGGVTETATVTVNVTPVNDAPVNTVPGAQTTAEDTSIIFSPSGGNAITVTDIDSGTLTVTVTVTNGAFSLSGTSGLSFSAGDGTSDQTMTFSGTASAINAALAGASYAPTADYNGPAQISVRTSDGALAANSTIAVDITPVADIANDSVSTDEDVPVVISVLANDSFENPGRLITAVDGKAITAGGAAVTVANGSVRLNGSGQLVFTPTLDYNGMANFTYTVTSGGTTETAQVTVAVASVNTPPVNTLPPTFTAIEDTALGLAGLQISDQDAGSGTMTVTLSVNSGVLSALAAGGVNVTGSGSQSLTLSGTLADINAYLAASTRPSYTPAANSTSSVTLTMTTNDNGNTGGMALVDIDTATISVTPVNDAPSGTDNTVTINEDATYTFSAASFGFSDAADSPANSFAAVVITTLPTNGVLALGGTPVTAGQVISAANFGNLTFTPAANANGIGLASFTFQVRDNGGTANGGQDTDQTPNSFTFNVTAVNDAPVNTLPATFGTNEDTALSLAGIQVTDVDAGTGAITVTLSVNSGTLTAVNGAGVTVSGSGSGTLVLNGTLANINGFLATAGTRPTFNPVANANGTVTLTMVTNDNGNSGSGGALSDTDTATITIAPVNDAPVGSDVSISTNEDSVFSGRLPIATDVDGDTLTYGAGTIAPSHGTVVVNPNGTYTYTPAANFNGTDSFTYSITDGTVTVQYLVNVTVNAVNDAPVGVNDTAQTNANLTASLNVLANDTDVDGDTLQVSAINGTAANVGVAVAGSSGGSFTIGANGNAIFNPGSAFDDLPAGQQRTSSVTYQLSDGHGGFSTATFAVTVTGVNDAPISTPIANQTGNDAQAISLSVAGNFSDPDTGDTLTFSATGLPPGLTINAATGEISGTINRSASVNGPYAVTVTATDRSGATASRSFTWAVLNPAPIAAADNLATTENASINGSVFANNGNGIDRDPDGDPISVSAVSGNAAGVGQPIAGSNGGTFTINTDGTYAFNPGTAFDDLAAGATRATTITYTITDGQGGFSTATVTVTVTGQNDAPVAVADSFTTNEDTIVTFDVRTNDSDIDGGTLAVTQINGTGIVSGGSVVVTGGTVTLNANGTLTFTPLADYNGTPSFTYTVSDGQGGTAMATVTGTVNAVQDPPVAQNDSFTTNEDVAVTFDVRGNDSDPDGDALSVVQINGASIASGASVAVTGGSVRLNANGTLTFTPSADYNGTPSFTYTISDGHGGTATATVNGTVTPVQDPPVAQNDSFTTAEDQPVTISVLANDSDPDGDALTITRINSTNIAIGGSVAVTGGSVRLNSDGTLTFTPTANFNGTPSFTYTVSDGNGGTATATVAGTVTPVNDAPVAVNDSFTTPEDTAVTFDVRGNDSDVDGDALTVTAINGAAITAGGSVTITGGSVRLNADGTLTFTPALNYNGSPTFTYTVSDGNGGSASATVSGTVTPVNDAPVAAVDTFTTPEDTAVTLDVRANDSDADGDSLSVTAIDGTSIAIGGSVAVTGGSVRLNADGTLTFTPALNYNGSPSFTYTVSDGNGGTATAAVNGTVTPVNDAPISSDTTVSVDEDGVLSGTLPPASDPDGDTISYAAGTTRPANGSLTVNSDGTYSYRPNANFNGTDRFSFVVSDGKGGSSEYTVTVNVAGVNDAPVGTPLPGRSGADGAQVNFNLSGFFSDADGDTLSYTATGLPSGLAISASGVVTGTIDRQASIGGPSGNGVYSVTIAVDDGHGGTTSQTFTFSVTNPAPIAVNDSATGTEDTAIVINVLDGSASGGVPDSDPDGDPLTVTAASAANGTVTIGSNGQITYQPNANFNGTDTIVYTISDGNGGTASATVTVTVAGVNDDPVGQPIADRTRNDGDQDTIDLAAFFSDPDGDALRYSVTGLPSGLTLDPITGWITGRIAADASGPTGERIYAVTVSASDGHGGLTSVTFNYTVLNLPPVAQDDTAVTNEDTPVDIDVLANDGDPDGDNDEVIRVNNVVLQLNGASVATAHGSVRLVPGPGDRPVLRFTPVANYNGQETFTYSIDDGNGGVDTATVTITILPQNDGPASPNPIPDRVRADGQSFVYRVADFFTDPDGDTLNYTITGLPAGLTFDTASGTILGTIDHDASQGGAGGIYTITVTAHDGPGGTGEAISRTFQLTVTNPGPTAANDTVVINEDQSATFNVITGQGTSSGNDGADIDPDGDTLTLISASAGQGTLTYTANGAITYTPPVDFSGTDTIVYTISDGQGGVSSATVTITINSVNDAPEVDGDIPTQRDSDGQQVSFDAGAYFSDRDGDTLSFSATDLPPGLSIDPATGVISGTLPSDASRPTPYTATITVSDGYGGTISQTITWVISNFAPKAADDVLSVGQNQSGGGNVLTNDSDPDGDALVIDEVNGAAASVGQAVTGSNGGTFTVGANGVYTFNPGSDFADLPAGVTRTTSVTYRVTDADGESDTATITVTVTGANDAPVATPIPGMTFADGQSLTDNPVGVGPFFSDIDGDTLTFGATGLPQGLSMNAQGVITGIINIGASQGGPYQVTVTANDGHGGTRAVTFSLTVTNPGPIAVNDTASTTEDTPLLNIDVLSNDTDPDGDPLSIDLSFPPKAAHGTVTVNADGTLNYTPDRDFNGVDTVVYRITDGQGGLSTGILTITVGAENDPPVAGDIADMERNDGDTINLDISSYFADPEGGALTFDVEGLPPGLTLNPISGVISGRISAGASGPMGLASYVVKVTATDAEGGSADTTFTYTIRNIAPDAMNDTATTSEDQPVDIPVLANDVDSDGDTNTITLVNGVNVSVGGPAVPTANGSVQLVLVNGVQQLRFTPTPDYVGTASFTYTVSDGNGGTDTATVVVTVEGVNDAPVASPIPDHSQADGSDVSFDLTSFFTDVDGDALTLAVTGLPPGLEYHPETGLISGRINADASTGSPYRVVVTADDGHGGTASTAFTFAVTNPAPIANNDTVATNEDTAVTFNPITGEGTTNGGADSDPDGDPLTIVAINGQAIAAEGTVAVTGGTVRLNLDGSLTFTPTADFNGTVPLTYRISDGNGGFADASISIAVASVNDVAVVDLNGGAPGGDISGNFNEGDAPVAIASGDAIIFDPEGGLTALNVALGGFADRGSEVIHLNGSVDIVYGTASSGTISFGGTTFSFTYDGANAVSFTNAAGGAIENASASALIRALQYENTSDNPTAGDRTFSVTVTDDGGATSDPAISTISIGAVNDAPVANDDTATTNEDTAITGAVPGVLGNDTDPDGDTLVVSSVGGAAPGTTVAGSEGGTFVINADGSYRFDPGADFQSLKAGETRVSTVTYEVSDGHGGTSSASLSVTVTGVNDAPIGSNGSIRTNEDTVASETLPIATDPDGDALTYAIATAPSNGVVTISADGSYTYTPPLNFNGTDSFTYSVSDGRSTVTYTIAIEVVPVDDAPVGTPIDNQSYADAQTVRLDVSGNFSDVDTPNLTFTASGLPSGLEISAAGLITGQVNSDASQVNGGIYTVRITASDGTSAAEQVFTIRVSNPAPIARDDAATTGENTDINGSVFANNGNGADSDPDGDAFVVSAVNGNAGGVGASVTGSGGGRFIIGADGSYSFVPGTDFDNLQVGQTRTTSVTYTISDGQGGTSTATFTVTVTGANDLPEGSDVTVSTNEDTALNGRLPAATDIDGDTLTYGAGAQPSHGSVTVDAAGFYTYTPATDFNGTDSFTYTISDGRAVVTHTVTVNVGAVNDAPVLDDVTVNVDEDGTTSGQLAATDADNAPNELTYGLQAAAQNGTAVVNADGSYSYTPNANFNGTDRFTVIVRDPGGASAVATITVSVGAINDAPVAVDDAASTSENTTVSGNVIVGGPGADSDPDGDPLTVVGVGAASGGVGASVAGQGGGTFRIAADGSYTFDPGTDFDRLAAGATATTSVSYTISDGHGGTATATLTVTVTGTNDAPTAPALSPQTSLDGDTVSVSAGAQFSDVDGGPLTFTVTGLPPGLAFNAQTGEITGKILPNASGSTGSNTYTVTVTANDGAGGTAARSFAWTVTNPAPTAVNDQFAVDEDTELSGSVLLDNGSGADSDPDGDPLAVSLVSTTAHGTLVLRPDGTFTYTPAPGFNGTDSFVYRISDGNGGTDTATATISVASVNDAPVAGNDNFTVTEDGQTVIAVLANDSDPDGDALSITEIDGQVISPGGSVTLASGTVTLNANGTLTFVAAPDYTGNANFSYTVSDGSLSVQGRVTGTVTAVNDAPVNTLPATFNGAEDTPLPLTGISISDVDAGTGVMTVTLRVDAGTLSALAGGNVQVAGSGSGALTLTGRLADINAYLAGASAPVYQPATNSNAPVTLTMITSDGGNSGAGGAQTDTDQATIILAAENDPPVAGGSLIQTQEDTPVSGVVSASDPDGDPLSFAVASGPRNGTATIDAAGRYLYSPNTNFNGSDSFNISISDGQGGVTTVTISVTVAAVNDAPVGSDGTATATEDLPLDGRLPVATDPDGDALTYGLGRQAEHGLVTVNADGSYRYVPAANYNGADSFTYTVSDGKTVSTYTISLSVTAVNDAPVGSGTSISVEEDETVNGQLPPASDADGDTVSYGLDTQAAHGTAVVRADGSYSYTPAPGYNGADSFVYSISDGTETVTYTVTVTVGAVDDPPSGSDATITVAEDGLVSGRLPVATDPDGDPLTYGLGAAPAHGTVVVNADGTYSYRPSTNFNGADRFTYTVSDGLDVVTYVVTINVTPVNDAPVGSNTEITVSGDSPFDGVLPAASDPDGDPLTYALGTQAQHGTITVNADGSYRYVPAADYNGSDSFTYQVSDGEAVSTYTVRITVTAVNDAPVGSNVSITVDEDGTATGNLPRAVDADGDPLTYLLQTGPSHGTATVQPDGRYNYIPDANYNGTDTFIYAISDGKVTSVYTVTVNVGAENDAPTGSNLAISVSEDASFSGSLPPASDADGDAVTYGLGTPAAHGAVTVNPDGTFTYTPGANYNGPDRFTYTLSDGTETVSYTVTINVRAVNDAPVGADTAISLAEDTPFSGTLPPATDADGDPVTYGLAAAAGHGTVRVNADGTFSYVPNANFNGTDSFSYSVSDGSATNVYRVTVTVSAVNDAPVGSNTSISVEQGTTASGSLPAAFDVEGSPLTYGLGAQAAHGTVTIGPTGTYTYQPAPGFAGTDQFTYTISDGSAVSIYTVTVSVGAANGAPVGQDGALTVAEDTPFMGRLPTATDPNGDAVTYGLAGNPAHGTVTIMADGRYTYIADRNYNGPDQFSYSVSDGRATVVYRVIVTVSPVNDAPVGSGTSISVGRDQTVSGRLPPAFDVEGTAVVYGLGSGPAHGTLTINPDGTYSYTPASGYEGADSFTFTVTDGDATSTYTVTISVGSTEPPAERPPLERDPPVQFPVDPNDPGGPDFDDDGNGLGSGMQDVFDDLGAISDDITADGPIDSVVNAAQPLNGIGSLPREGAVLHAVHQIADWIESGRRLDDLHIGFFKGGSNIHLAGVGEDSTWFTVDTIFHKDYLYIMPKSSGDVEDATFSVTLADGRALPDWMTTTHGGMIIGRPPVGTVSIDIRIWGTSKEGTISDSLRIDLQTGTILDHIRDRRADLGKGTLFSDQMLAEAKFDGSKTDKLWAALQGR